MKRYKGKIRRRKGAAEHEEKRQWIRTPRSSC